LSVPSPGYPWLSTDSGLNWSPVNNVVPVKNYLSCTMNYSGSVIFLYGNNEIHRSIDGGANWLTPITAFPDTYSIVCNRSADSSIDGKFVLCFTLGLPMLSSNFGQSFAVITGVPVNFYEHGDISFTGRNMIIGSLDVITNPIYKSIDCGLTWNPDISGISNLGVMCITIRNSKNVTCMVKYIQTYIFFIFYIYKICL
jgi:hypothetical protein